MKAHSTFTNDGFEPETWHSHGGNEFGFIHITRTFSGDLAGTAKAELVTVQSGDDGSATYVAIDAIEGSLGGKTGGFALWHRGTVRPGGGEVDGAISPDSGTGELAGISGTGTIHVDGDGTHHLDLEYELG
jgi:uncharacterized protein DUF3224